MLAAGPHRLPFAATTQLSWSTLRLTLSSRLESTTSFVAIDTQTVLVTGDLPGQPDSIAVSPDCTRAIIAIENERDEDVNDGNLPQLPPGSLVVMDLSDVDPKAWTLQMMNITGLPNILYPDDPEPEFVNINTDNVAVVTLQENNGIVLIDLKNNSIMASFSAGSVNLTQIDINEDLNINQTGSLTGVLREPDGVTWISTDHFVTANEGDLDDIQQKWRDTV
jgi:hypothetical protein